MLQTSESQLLRRILWINAEMTIVSILKHKNTQPIYIFNKENPQNSEPQNGPRRGLDFIALSKKDADEQLPWIPAITNSSSRNSQQQYCIPQGPSTMSETRCLPDNSATTLQQLFDNS